MSMIRAQEYFAPLRSRHISLQQWERGQLFESWGSRGGRHEKQKSVDLDVLATSDNDEHDPVRSRTKGCSRSLSFSPSLAKETELEQSAKPKLFPRALSFSRSTTSSAEIVPDVSNESQCGAPKSYTTRPECRSKTSAGLLFSRSFQRGRTGSDISGISQSMLGSPAESRHRAKKFFSGVLSFSKEKKMLSGILTYSKSFGVVSDSLQAFNARNICSPDEKGTSSDTNQDVRLKKNLFARVFSFSRSLDLRGEKFSSLVRGISLSFKGTDFQEKELFGRNLSFSRSLDSNGECSLSKSDNDKGSNENLQKEADSWHKKFISRSGFFFSRSNSPVRRDSTSESGESGIDSDKIKDARSKKCGGRYRGLSFSWRFLDPTSESSSDSSISNTFSETRSESSVEKDREFPSQCQTFKNFFSRGFFSARCLVPKGSISSQSGCPCARETSESNGKIPSKKFSKDWSWPHNTNSDSRIPITKASSPTDLEVPAPAVLLDIPRNGSSFNGTSSRNSHALKQWWFKRSRSANITSQSVLEGGGNYDRSKLVLLERVPAVNDEESDDDLTVYVGERGSTLTKYILARKVLRHHLFQVLLKCSQDELGSDHDYNSGVPIICDPALFLQVARAVGGNCATQP